MKKAKTMLALSDKISKSQKPNLKDLFEMTNRIKKWSSCAEPQVFDAMPTELKDIIKGTSETVEPEYSQLNVAFKILVDMGGAFPKEGTCGFYPERIKDLLASGFDPNIQDPAEYRRLFHMELFGCEEADVISYQENLTSDQRRVAELFVKLGTTVIDAQAKQQSPEETSKAMQEMLIEAEHAQELVEKELPADIGSLDKSSLVEMGEDWVWFVPFIIPALILCVLALHIALCIIIGFIWALGDVYNFIAHGRLPERVE